MPGPRHISHTHQRALENAAFQERRQAAANAAEAEEARIRLAGLPEHEDQEIRFLESMMTGSTRFQPGIVLENPKISNDDKDIYFSLEDDYKTLLKFISGEKLIEPFDFNIRVNITGHLFDGITVKGNPIINPKITQAVKDNYTKGIDNPFDIPIYFIVRGLNGGHLSLLIWIKGVIYSLGCAFTFQEKEEYRSIYEYISSLAKQSSLVKMILDTQKQQMESATPVAAGGGNPVVAAAAAVPVAAVAALGAAKVGEALHAHSRKGIACFYSPDTLIKPHEKTSKGKFFQHKLYDMGFLKTRHIQRINQFVEKGKAERLAQKEIDGHKILIEREQIFKTLEYSTIDILTGKLDVEMLGLTLEEISGNFGIGCVYSQLGKVYVLDKTIFPKNNVNYFVYAIDNKQVAFFNNDKPNKTLEEIKALIVNHDTGAKPLTIKFLVDPTESTGNPSVPSQPWHFDLLSVNLAASYTHVSNEYDVTETIDNFNCTSFLASVFRERISCLGRWRFSRSLEEVGSYVALMSNPKSCRTRTYYGLDYPDPASFFRAFENFVLDVKAHKKKFSDLTPDMFNVLNDSVVRPSVSPLHIRNRLNRFGLHGLAKLGDAVVPFLRPAAAPRFHAVPALAAAGGKRRTKNKRRRSNKTRKQRR